VKYAEDLAKHGFVHVRVSLKGCSEEEFVTLTGAKQEGFTLQLKALENMLQAGVKCHPAVMTSFSTEKSLQQLTKRLEAISPQFAEELEIEELILYPSVQRKIEKHRLKYHTAHTPKAIPKEQI